MGSPTNQNRLRLWGVFWCIAPLVLLIALIFVGMYWSLPLAFVLMLLTLIPCYHAVKVWLELTNDTCLRHCSANQRIMDTISCQQDGDTGIATVRERSIVIDVVQDDALPSYEQATGNELIPLSDPSLRVWLHIECRLRKASGGLFWAPKYLSFVLDRLLLPIFQQKLCFSQWESAKDRLQAKLSNVHCPLSMFDYLTYAWTSDISSVMMEASVNYSHRWMNVCLPLRVKRKIGKIGFNCSSGWHSEKISNRGVVAASIKTVKTQNIETAKCTQCEMTQIPRNSASW